MFGSAMDIGMPVTLTHNHKAASKPTTSMSTPQAPTIPSEAAAAISSHEPGPQARTISILCLAPEAGDAVVQGTDFGVVTHDNRLDAITGFFDQVRQG